ncbi:MAG: repressor LexA [Oscillospiraceae bacterium]|nr:repressor LexA [Oscillospiraceae bacterium]
MRSKSKETIAEIEQFVRDQNDRYGRSPTMQEIGDAVGISLATAYRYIKAMEKDGLIDYCGVRGITAAKSRPEQTGLPVIGQVACGTPILAEENVEEYVRLPVSLIGRGKFFILRAKGNSMINVGIEENDLVIVRQQDTADPGQIVVALIDDEATLKRYWPEPENRRIRLQPENSEMDDIYVDCCQIQGVAVRVLKNLEGK